MANLSIKSKLLVILLAVSVLSIAVVASLNYYTCYKSLRENTFSHLTSVRASRADQIEQFIERLRTETRVIGASGVVSDAARELIAAYRALDGVAVDPAVDEAVRAYYIEQYLPALAKAMNVEPELAELLPNSRAARYLQYTYIAKNPFPFGERSRMDGADVPSAYAAVHERVHPALRRIVEDLGFIDGYIADIETGAIVYSVEKEVDFGTRLSDGPYGHSNLGALFRKLQAVPDRGAVLIVDFEEYRPTRGRPSAFVGTPVYAGGRLIAALMLQLSDVAIDRVMTGDQQWEKQGLGKTGETYLVGPDHLMRSNSRFLLQEPERYTEQLREAKVPETEIARMLEHKSSILIQRSRSYASEQALAGNEGTGVVLGYRGIEMLGSWAPLEVAGLQWGIVAKIDREEAYAPMTHMARDTLIQTLVIVLVITLAVMFLATSFVRPVNDLIDRVRRARAGAADFGAEADSQDELGDLSRSFRELIDSVRKQTRLLEEATHKNEALLRNVMPRGVAERVQVGQDEIIENIDDVTVVFAELRGLAEYTRATSDSTSVAALKKLIVAFDDAARERGVEPIRTVGDTYLAATGLSQPLLDHRRRSVDFAIAARRIVHVFNREANARLGVTVGIASGPVVVDAMGRGQFMFQLWGTAVIAADHAMDCGDTDEIIVDRSVYDGLRDQYEFVPVERSDEVPLWKLATHD
jgi:class 3 adenylate cyclase